MFTLSKFFPLLEDHKNVMIVDNRSGEVLYDGMAAYIPDEYDDCKVSDFGIHSSGAFSFDIKVAGS